MLQGVLLAIAAAWCGAVCKVWGSRATTGSSSSTSSTSSSRPLTQLVVERQAAPVTPPAACGQAATCPRPSCQLSTALLFTRYLCPIEKAQCSQLHHMACAIVHNTAPGSTHRGLEKAESLEHTSTSPHMQQHAQPSPARALAANNLTAEWCHLPKWSRASVCRQMTHQG
jgi:hypothetical protein